MKPSADSQEISLSVSMADKLVRVGLEDIGRTATILHNGITYSAIFTAVDITKGIKTLTFGFARTDLTSLLKLQRRGVTW